MINITGSGLSISDVYDIAVNGAPVKLDGESLKAVKRSYDRVQEWGAAKHPMYGVNTGFGELAHIIIPPQFKSALQYNLLRSHAAGIGETFPDEVVRAIMVARLNCLMKGYSGVSPQSVELLQHFLNHGIHPVIPQQGSLGASGDLSPLAHMALPLIGDGFVRIDGALRRSAEVLEEQNLQPIKAGFKEALALINGTSGMTGAACIALVKAYKLLKLELLASADFLQCLSGSSRAFDERGHVLKNHFGQVAVARTLRKLIAGSSLIHEHKDLMKTISEQSADSEDVVDATVFLQHAYTLRCIPQILGPVLDTLNFCRKLVEEEVNSCNDNPLIFETPEDSFHGGHFHGQYVAMSCDFLNIALTEIGVLAERQLNRLLDPHLNGNLPAFLADGQTGLFCGYEGAQYLATSIASENLDIAAPASIKTIPSNGQNQDVVSMGLIAARKSLQLCENVNTILTVLVAACCQASYFIGPEKFNAPIQELHRELSPMVPLYKDEFPINEILSQVCRFLKGERAWAYLDEQIDLDA
jgi:tyrosine 2,3-aminomutase